MKCRALIVGIQTIRPPWRAVSKTAYSFRPVAARRSQQ
jgi:hypothetical protein